MIAFGEVGLAVESIMHLLFVSCLTSPTGLRSWKGTVSELVGFNVPLDT